MKTGLIIVTILLTSSPLFARKKQMLYFSNGNKVLEGHWTYIASTFQKTSLTDAAMAGMDGRSDFTEESPETARPGGFPMLSGQYSDTSKATDFWRLHFNIFEAQLEGNRDAGIVFFQKNGDSLAVISLKNGLRDGRWKQWTPGGQLPPVTLEYKDGRLRSIDEGDGSL